MRSKTLKRMLSYTRTYWVLLIISVLAAFVSVVFNLYIPILIGNAVDFIVGKGQVNFNGIIETVKKIIIVAGITGISQWIMNLCNNRITYGVVKDIRQDAFERIQILPLKYIDGHSHGEVVSRVISDADQFSEGLLLGFNQFFTGILTIFGTLIFMLTQSIRITLVVILVTPLSLVLASYITKRTYVMFQAQSKERGEITSHIEEMIGNQKVVKAFGYEKRSLKKFDEINERLKASGTKATFYSSIVNPSTRFVNGLVYAGVGVVGAFYVMKGGISIGTLTCFLTYANQYTKPFNEISGVIAEMQNAFACAERIFELIDEKPQIPEKQEALSLGKTRGEVLLDHVSFSYDKEKKLIDNFNLTVKPGQRIAIVGPTGCGKTTIINLLMRFYDVDKGSIKVDGADIRDVTRKSLRKNYGMVLQDTWIRKGTIRDNIIIGKKGATEDEIITAAKESHAHSFIKRLPDAYDTFITEGGENLSQGQRQLLCITRVMLSLPPMLILDEATSSIDTRTEIKIQKAFSKMMEGRSSFVVAHRLSTIQEADVILVMNDGNIVEQGNHEELLRKNGFYAGLFYSQFQKNQLVEQKSF